ncbi:LysR family transcriptional regulator [Kosakonia oryziphila]|uniref:Regulatory helix-turn-helix protein, lysR family n=1 Tax=Kosakonia oryziphila TaxID=1005667 RepID=A0A1C4GNG9_9ENTR|nr:LysR family transcriptional regulator [Kosakonia oryziphila]SCC69750.1 regulatory helix-turn-helix protein, lysR family [Kosakonia oryziphila]
MNIKEENCTKQNFSHLKKIDLNSALYFVSVMNYKTVFNASIVLHCSPPTVSVMLSRFCSYFPVPLFEREGRTLNPTRFAMVLHKKIESIFLDIDELFSDELPR